MNADYINEITFPCCVIEAASRKIRCVNERLNSLMLDVFNDDASAARQLEEAAGVIASRIGDNEAITFSYELINGERKKPLKIRCQYMDENRQYILVIFHSDLSNYVAAVDFSVFAELIPGGLMLVRITDDGRYTAEYVNNGLLNMLGYTRAECEKYFAHDIFKFIHPDDVQPGLKQYFEQTAKTNDFYLTGRLICKNGVQKIVAFTGKRVTDGNGAECVYCAVTDITQNRQLLDEVFAERQVYSVVQSISKHIFFKYEIENRKISYYGFSLKSFEDETFAQYTYEQMLERQRTQGCSAEIFEVLFSNIEHGVREPKTVMVRNREGKMRWLMFTYDFVYNRSGKAILAIGQVEDVTAQAEAKAYYDKALSLWSIDQSCDTQVALNLSTNTVVDGRSALFSHDELIKLTTDEYFSRMYMAIADDSERKRLPALLCRDALIKCFINNERRLQFEAEANIGSEHKWVRMLIELVENPINSSIIALIKWKNINDVKLQKAINTMLISDTYDFTCCIFTKTNSYMMIDNIENNHIYPNSVSFGYEKLMGRLIDKYCDGDDEEYLKFCFSIKNLTERLKTMPRYTFIGHGIYPDGSPAVKSHEFMYLDKKNGIILYSRRDVTNNGNQLALRMERTICNLEFSEIRYIESFGRKCEVTTVRGVFTANESISAIQKKLPGKLFTRCHRSYIISIAAIECVEKDHVRLTGGKRIPVNRQSIALLKSRFQQGG